jgi:rhodanese-related sulfurtransferase
MPRPSFPPIVRFPFRRRARRRPAAALSLSLISPFLGIGLGLGSPEDLPKVAAVIEARFPSLPHVGVEELERTLARPPEERPVLLDVRSAEEFAVSHIEGALQAETVEEALAALQDVDPGRTIVLYCSVGLRSAELADELREAGFTDLRNLRGSLFGWANSGRPVVRGGEPVGEVHPYNGKWGKLLREELRASPDDAGP